MRRIVRLNLVTLESFFAKPVENYQRVPVAELELDRQINKIFAEGERT